MSIPIHPQTKVGDLLREYPGIDEVLIGWVPAFSKLRNPILRKTVAKVATLEQAARVGGVEVRDLVRKLREAAGQDAAPVDLQTSLKGPPEAEPAWVGAARVRVEIDADAMLERGVHPIGKVRESAAALEPGEIVRLLSSFRPEPLIATMRHGGFDVFSAPDAAGRHVTSIGRPIG